ncbi:GNAT family N-acetyltransferase [Reichenbachiella agarivorans]|uniref:GNAT family N-acetyltransferase n=1 Tax=Reichenbachiella agarivorans TaxID=2979464 RepID=A0ABY6CJV6_9BACT|nr:GNAT family N-acetyltransferase [Reichenbachiella agarivorans]UXP30812.1 GNAT family N-acetyltransferase [Reichenbachiella agarivorans]
MRKADMRIDSIQENEYTVVLDVWEASVRATHDFLKEEDIAYFKPLILNEYLYAVELRGVRNEEGKIIAFVGAAEDNLEMLFVHPSVRGQGIGKILLQYAVAELGIIKVDVNEQNQQAIGFYEHEGFKTIGRSELDASGKPYPILHMQLS